MGKFGKRIDKDDDAIMEDVGISKKFCLRPHAIELLHPASRGIGKGKSQRAKGKSDDFF
jgi:hypothetical protein